MQGCFYAKWTCRHDAGIRSGGSLLAAGSFCFFSVESFKDFRCPVDLDKLQSAIGGLVTSLSDCSFTARWSHTEKSCSQVKGSVV